MPRVRTVVTAALFGLSLAVVAAAITAVYLSMRDVMAIGGSCASGGPYEIANPCPEGTAALMAGGIPAGMAAVAVAGLVGSRLPGGYGGLVLLAWPGLFLSLGWNFLEYGLDSPTGGTDAGLLFCAVVFFLMGGVPLLVGLRGVGRLLWPADPEVTAPAPSRAPATTTATTGPTVAAAGSRPHFSTGPPADRTVADAPVRDEPEPDEPEPDEPIEGIADQLERLAALRQHGMIDDDEFERAKDIALGRTASGADGGGGKDGGAG